MTKFVHNISQFIQSQFPEHMREQGQEITTSERAVLIDFVEAYYEWLEDNYSDSTMLNREMITMDDVDTTLDEYIKYFREKYLKDFPYVAATDERFLIKNIIDLYRTKGTPRSIKLLIRMLFNKDAEVYLPGSDVFRLSHSKWYEPKYLEVLHEDGTFDLMGKQVVGTISKAKAFVEGVVTKRINGVFIDVIYITDIKGTFQTGDRVVDISDGVVSTSPLVIGSLSSITTTDTSLSGISVGDIFDVVSSRGEQGRAKVTETHSFGRQIELSIEDGGYGFTTDDMTTVYVTDTIVYANTVPASFNDFELVTQKLETVVVGNNEYGTLSSVANAESFAAYDAANNETANGVLIDLTPWTVDDEDATLVFQIDGGTVRPCLDLNLTDDTMFTIGETIEEGDDVTMILDSSNGSFSAGDIVYQSETVGTTITHYAVGVVVSANADQMSITNSFGDWRSGNTVFNYNNVLSEAEVLADNDITVTYEGGTGIISEVSSNTSIKVVTANTGKFAANNEVRGLSSGANTYVSNTADVSATTIVVDGDEYNIQSTANVYWTANIVESSNTVLKMDTVTNEFKYMDSISILHGESGNTVIITGDTAGADFNFEIGSIENSETVKMSTITFNSTNIADVSLLDLTIDGLNSSVYRVAAISPSVAGTGYSNGDVVTIIGGGVSNNTPYIPARGYVTTNGSGAVTSVTMIEEGQRYITEDMAAIVDTSGGSSATFNITTETGYGFEGALYGNANSTIEEAFNFEDKTIGTIKTLSNVNLGTGYTITPAIYIDNPYVSTVGIFDKTLNIQLTSKSFKVGEIITQNLTNARGIVQSYNTITKNMLVRVISFEDRFLAGNSLTGLTTAATADVISVTDITSDPVMGENSEITLSIVAADGVIKTLKVIDSGFGYIDDESITLDSSDGSITGTAAVETQGISAGFWRTFDSHASDIKKLHDNYYYQEYSYDIKTPVPLDKYKQQIKDILHVAGTEYFGSVSKQTEKQLTLTSEVSISVA